MKSYRAVAQSKVSPAGTAWPSLPPSPGQDTAAPPLQTLRSWHSAGTVWGCSCTFQDLETTHTQTHTHLRAEAHLISLVSSLKGTVHPIMFFFIFHSFITHHFGDIFYIHVAVPEFHVWKE